MRIYYYFFFLLLFVVNLPIHSQDKLVGAHSNHTAEQALFLRRIIDFWEEGESEIVKKEIENYLADEEKSSFSNYLQALLGDLYMKEKNFSKALSAYDEITDQDILDVTTINRFQCLYEIEEFSQLAEEAQIVFEERKEIIPEEDRGRVTFYVADAFYRWALLLDKEDEEEQRVKLAEKSKKYFLELLSSEYQLEATEALANVHYLMKNYEAASEFFTLLAQKDEKSKEEYLFQAATFQSYFNTDLAVDSFEKIVAMKKNKYKEAAYNRLLIMFESEKFDQIIAEKDSIKELLPDEKASSYFYFLGKSYYKTGNYSQSVGEIKRFLKLAGDKDSDTRNSLLTLIQCAIKTDSISDFLFAFNHFETYFPKDEEMSQVLLAKAFLEKRLGNIEETEKDFKRIKNEFDNFRGKEEFLFQYALFSYELGNKKESRVLFKEVLTSFPNSSLKKTYLRYFITTSIEIARDCSEEEADKKLLFNDLSTFLSVKDLTTEEERREYQFLMIQCKFNLNYYLDVIEDLSQWVKNDTTSSYLPQIYYMLSICHYHFEQYNEFCLYAEKALSEGGASIDKRYLHLALYNIYLDMAGDEEKKDKYLHLASNHLFEAQNMSMKGIKPNNIFWLVDYLYFSVINSPNKNEDGALITTTDEYVKAKKGIELLNKMLFPKENKLTEINEKNLFLEAAVIKLANLYSLLGDKDSQCKLLEDLVVRYDLYPSYDWAHVEQAFFSLAGSYEYKNDNIKALVYYNKLLSFRGSSYLQAKGALKRARIRSSLLKLEKIGLDKSEVYEDINHLKNLCIYRKLENEPLHLEAILEYVDLQCLVDGNKNTYEKKYNLLKKLKSQFDSDEDILSREYHHSRKLSPEKDKIYQAYMALIESEILISQANLVNEAEAIKMKDKAQILLKNLKENNLILNRYIKERMAANLALLEKTSNEIAN